MVWLHRGGYLCSAAGTAAEFALGQVGRKQPGRVLVGRAIWRRRGLRLWLQRRLRVMDLLVHECKSHVHGGLVPGLLVHGGHLPGHLIQRGRLPFSRALPDRRLWLGLPSVPVAPAAVRLR